MSALFVFAHQDDEYAAAPWIVEEVGAGGRVACVYLTNGGSRTQPAIRDAETLGVLQWLGVEIGDVAFLQADGDRIDDGKLAARISDGFEMLERWIEESGLAPERIYAPSYEGGHADHDAAHCIAAACAIRRGLLGGAWHFSLYNAYRVPRPFFATMRQLPTDRPKRTARLPWRERWSMTMACWHYRSQRRTWLALFPGALVQRAILARECVVLFDRDRLGQRPHEGELLYERLFGVRYGDFAESTRRFVAGTS